MNELQIFENEQFGTIRVIEKDSEPWFVAADVCRSLDISDTWNALQRLDNDEKGTCLVSTPGGEQKMNIVNEPGLYVLVLGSRKLEAKAFKRWITHDVLPTIKKHGMYMTPKTIDDLIANPDLIIQLATQLKEEREARKHLEEENEIQRQTIEDYEPKVQYYDTILQSNEALTVTQIAADYGMSAQQLNKILQEEGFQRRVGKQWILYREHMGNGYTKSETIKFLRSDGTIGSNTITKWTQKGRLKIHNILESRGIKALMDQQDIFN